MQDMIDWLKSGISDGYISSDEAFTWLAQKSKRATGMPVKVVEYPASGLQQRRPSSSAKPRAAAAQRSDAPAFNKDGTPRRKPGRKPKATPADGVSTANGVE